jgi:hypothetical protein
MAAGDSALSICSDALIMLGAKPISSFNDGTDEANTCDRLYADIRDQALLIYPWSFSFKKVALAQLVTTPTTEYKYEYALPGDKIGPPRALFTSASPGDYPRKEYRIFGDTVMTDYTAVWIDYPYSVPEYSLPVYFIQLLKYMMAWHLAMPITDQGDKASYWQGVAVGSPSDNGRGGYLRTAMQIDGAGQPSNSINDFSLIAVRY